MRSESTAREAPAKRRILIVENHPLVLRGRTALIDSEADLTVCATVAAPQAGLDAHMAAAISVRARASIRLCSHHPP